MTYLPFPGKLYNSIGELFINNHQKKLERLEFIRQNISNYDNIKDLSKDIGMSIPQSWRYMKELGFSFPVDHYGKEKRLKYSARISALVPKILELAPTHSVLNISKALKLSKPMILKVIRDNKSETVSSRKKDLVRVREEEIVAKFKSGTKRRQLYEEFNSYWAVDEALNKAGYESNRYKAIINEDGSRTCPRCNSIKDEDLFRSHYRKRLNAVCNECRNKTPKKIPSDPIRVLYSKFLSSKSLCIRQGMANFHTILWEEVLDLYNHFGGKCFYTDEEMVLKRGIDKSMSWDVLSFDKIMPSLGYTSGNVVLCKKRINTIKSNLKIGEIERYMPDWHGRILKFYEWHAEKYGKVNEIRQQA